MNRTEQRLRDTLDGAARTVRRQDLRPLAAPTRRRRSLGHWFAPAAAAASIAVLVGVSTVVLAPLADRGGTPSGGQTAAVAAPPFFVVLEGPRKLVVRSARNGKPIDHTGLPKGTAVFSSVAGTSDPHVFLVAAGTKDSCRSHIFRLRLHATGEVLSLDRITTVPTDVRHLTATRDGTKVAFNSGDACSDGKLGITVLDLLSDESHTWTGDGGRVVAEGLASLSLASEGHTLLFSWYGAGSDAGQIRSIDPAHPQDGTDLLKQAKALVVTEDVGVMGRYLLQAAIRRYPGTKDTKPGPMDTIVGVADARWPADGPGGAAIISLDGRGRPDKLVASFPESDLVTFDTAATGRSLLVRTEQGIGRLDNGKFRLLVRHVTASSLYGTPVPSPDGLVVRSPSPSDGPGYFSASPGTSRSGEPLGPKEVEQIFDFAW